MTQLTLEKKEALNGHITYYILHGVTVVDSFSETGADALYSVDGISVARSKAENMYEYYAQRQKQGYPKTEILKSQTI